MMAKTFLLSILQSCLLLSSAMGMVCNHPYIRLATGCYYFSGTHSANWWKAAEVCRGLNGALAVISDPVENEAIRQHLLQEKTGLSYYLGGYDMGHEGVWYWESTRKPIDFFDWISGQPDNQAKNEHCLDLRPEFEYHWNDYPCALDRNSFICEALPEKQEIIWKVTGMKFQVEPALQPVLSCPQAQ